MGKYLDFTNDKFEKGYEHFSMSRENFFKKIGSKICFVTTRDTDKNRGTYFVRYATIHSVKYSRLLIGENGYSEINISDILECGIEIKPSN